MAILLRTTRGRRARLLLQNWNVKDKTEGVLFKITTTIKTTFARSHDQLLIIHKARLLTTHISANPPWLRLLFHTQSSQPQARHFQTREVEPRVTDTVVPPSLLSPRAFWNWEAAYANCPYWFDTNVFLNSSRSNFIIALVSSCSVSEACKRSSFPHIEVEIK